jgi:hypothetical protein
MHWCADREVVDAVTIEVVESRDGEAETPAQSKVAVERGDQRTRTTAVDPHLTAEVCDRRAADSDFGEAIAIQIAESRDRNAIA